MLAPDDRATLLSELKPPPGYGFSHLLTTTFTLDLESALLPCLALAGSSQVESADVVETIAAIRSTIDAIDIFHQNGQICVPRLRSRLFSLLEDATHGVTPTRGLFHPKVWLGVYPNPDDADDTALKLIVLSRNLTRDRSWDITLNLDGWLTSSTRSQNDPLADFIRYLAGALTTPLGDARRGRLVGLADSIRKAEWQLPDGAIELAFHIFGVPGRQASPDFSGNRHLVMAPFLESAGIARIAKNASKPLTVVSRQDALNKLDAATASRIGNAFVLSPTAGISSDDDETPSSGTLFTGLHAKMYAVERAKQAHLFVGSANATGAAFNHNVEILVELIGGPAAFGVDVLLGGDGLQQILEATEIARETADDDEAQHRLDQFVRAIAAVPLTATLQVSDDGDQADLKVTSDLPVPDSRSGATTTISLLTDPSTSTSLQSGVPLNVTYPNVALTDVTAFFVVTAHDSQDRSSSTVVKANLIGDIPARLDKLVTNEIKDPDAFRRFLALLLAFGEIAPDTDEDEGQGSAGGGQWDQLEQGLFEQMMRASVARPEVLDRLAGVVRTIVDDGDPHGVLPNGFAELWTAIDDAVRKGSGANV